MLARDNKTLVILICEIAAMLFALAVFCIAVTKINDPPEFLKQTVVAILFIVGIPAMIVSYMLPTLVAWWRGHHNLLAIVVANILLVVPSVGIIWVLILVWACTAVKSKENVHLHHKENVHHHYYDH